MFLVTKMATAKLSVVLLLVLAGISLAQDVHDSDVWADNNVNKFGIAQPNVEKMTANGLRVAAKVFQDAESYHKFRIDHSVSAGKIVVEKLRLKDNGTILELAAGTGKLTGALVQALKNTSNRLVSSEPTESMRRVFKKNFPVVELIPCNSEEIPLPDSSVQGITAANAAHFLSSAKSFAEMNRVLVPGGGVAFIYLDVDALAAPWFATVADMVAEYYSKVGVYQKYDENGVDRSWQDKLNSCGYFEKLQVDSSHGYIASTSKDKVLGLIMSFGGFHACSETERETIQKRILGILDENYRGSGADLIELPMRSTILYTQKKDSLQ